MGRIGCPAKASGLGVVDQLNEFHGSGDGSKAVLIGDVEHEAVASVAMILAGLGKECNRPGHNTGKGEAVEAFRDEDGVKPRCSSDAKRQGVCRGLR